MWKITIEPKFKDTDALGHVNNNIIGEWFELARNDIFKIFNPKLNLDNWNLILVHTEFDFLAQIFYGNEVEIKTFIEKIGNSSFTIGHELWQNSEVKAKGTCVLVHFNYTEAKSQKIPDDIRFELEKHLFESVI